MSSFLPCASIYAETLYDGRSHEAQSRVLIEVEAGRIVAVHAGTDPRDLPPEVMRVPMAMPGFIDLQINGAGDVQFNFEFNRTGLETMVAASARGGATHIFPTFTAAPGKEYRQALEVVTKAVQDGIPGVAGVHLEGPFLSSKRPGIHNPDFLRPLTQDDVEVLCGASQSLRILLTLAPEEQDPDLLRQLYESGITLFAGHTEASADNMTVASQVGVTGVTHLFNAMRQMTPREPGVVGTVLSTGDFYAGIIADGHHVHPLNLSLAVQTLPDHLCLVSDAMQTMNGTSQGMQLYEQKISLQEGRLVGEDGTLGGAHLTMAEAVRNITQLTHASIGQAAQFASSNPARALNLHQSLGCVSTGYSASLTLLDDALDCIGVLRDGFLHTFADHS